MVPDNPLMRMTELLFAVGGSDPKAFSTIGSAIAGAHEGDVIQIPAGKYTESISLPAGIELRPMSPGTVTLVAPAGAEDWTAITATGARSTIRGLRIQGTTASPMSRGIDVSGDGVVVDDVTFDGVISVGVNVAGTNAVVRASRFEQLAGIGVRLEADGASLVQNVFKAASSTAAPAVDAIGGVTATFDSNVFKHFPRVVEPESRTESLIGRDNFVIVATPKR